jgi:hypothetical protein
MIQKYTFFSFILLLTGLLLARCTEKQLVQAKIVDENNQPIEDAILYFEVYDNNGTYDFGFAETDKNGETPGSGSKALYTEWNSDSHISLTAFSKGKKPVVLYDQLGNITATGMTITLYNLAGAKLKWEPRIAKLAFPFEDNQELFKKAAQPNAKPLRDAFYNAYKPLIDGNVTAFNYEKEKIDVLKKLEKESLK